MTARLIFGCGYLGYRVARRWQSAGDAVYAVTRSAERAEAWRAEGIIPILADVIVPETLRDLPAAETVFYAVSHDARRVQASGFRVQELEPHVVGLRNVLGALAPTFRRVIYISSTGVYGDFQGAWVNEDSPCHPLRGSGKACSEAEKLLTAHEYGKRAVILRPAGLYGPGRIPRKDVLLTGEPIDAPQHGYLNLIHVEDAVEAVLAADGVEAPLPRRYLISDGSPVVRSEYYAELARLIEAPPPRFRVPDRETPASARAAADKCISNARMLAELRITLRYPSYREGLRAIVEGESLRHTGKDTKTQSGYTR
jgi:nucleoside-diphosphate-sugar epimerase